MAPVNKISLRLDHCQIMVNHVTGIYPREACGLLGGILINGIGTARMAIPVPNILNSRTRFQMDPQKQLDALITFQHSHLDLLAICHSHPVGPALPSETDLAEFYYPESASIIWTFQDEHWNCRAFIFIEKGFTEIPVVLGNK